MKNIAMRLTYDGSKYHGWQYQKNGVTIQQILEEALSEITGEQIKVTGCSRTDAGVHAIDYVMNFKSSVKIPVDKLPYALNYKLNSDITALEAWEADEDFNARFSSKGKRYEYKIWNGKMRNPFFVGYSWYLPYTLDREKMKEAAQHFIGTHDFSAFMAAGGSQKTTVRTIRNCSVTEDSNHKELITIAVEADAFLYNMVRIITGTLAEVGTGKILPEEIPDIINSGDRCRSGLTAPPDGLFLKKVFY